MTLHPTRHDGSRGVSRDRSSERPRREPDSSQCYADEVAMVIDGILDGDGLFAMLTERLARLPLPG